MPCPSVAFSWVNTAEQEITFTASSTHTGDRVFFWDFGDGTTARTTNPVIVHQYPLGHHFDIFLRGDPGVSAGFHANLIRKYSVSVVLIDEHGTALAVTAIVPDRRFDTGNGQGGGLSLLQMVPDITNNASFDDTINMTQAGQTIAGGLPGTNGYTSLITDFGNPTSDYFQWTNGTTPSTPLDDIWIVGGRGADGPIDPTNITFATRKLITKSFGGISGNLRGGGTEAGLYPTTGNPCAATGVTVTLNRSVWYEWVAPFTGNVQFDTLEAQSRSALLWTGIGVYTGTTLGSLVEIAFNNYSGVLSPSLSQCLARVTFACVQGTSYKIMVGQYGNSRAPFLLRWQQVSPVCGAGLGPDSMYLLNPVVPIACPIPDDAPVFDAEIDPLAPVLHTMAWATDTMISRNRIEQRRSLRRYPAHVLEFSVDAVSPRETSRIDALLQLGAPDGFRVPFWPDRVPLPAVLPVGSTSISMATEGYSFVGDEEMIFWSSPFSWEIVGIASVSSGSINFSATLSEWIAGTLVMPVKKGYLPASVNPSRLSRDGQSTTLNFILCGWAYPAADAPATYLDYEMFDVYPARLFDASETVENFADVLESKAGAFAISWLSEEHPWERKFNWFCATRADIAAVRAFAHRRQGKFKPFWVPTWASDFLLLAPSSIGATTFTVHDSGKDAIRSYVAFITVDAIYPRAIVNYTDNLDGTRTLEVDVAIPVALAENTTVISYLSLAHFADDEMPMDFVEMNTAEVELDWTEMVPLPVPV